MSELDEMRESILDARRDLAKDLANSPDAWRPKRVRDLEVGDIILRRRFVVVTEDDVESIAGMVRNDDPDPALKEVETVFKG